MKQPDYATIAPRGQMPPQQNQFQQPGYGQPVYPQQQQGYYQQPGYVPQQGYAPQQPNNGYFVPHQAMMGMEGSQEFRDAYQKNLDAFNETNRKIKEGINESDAVRHIKEMAEYKSKVDGTEAAAQGAANIGQMLNTIEYLCLSLENPQEWIPAYRAKYVEPMRNQSKDIVAALRKTADVIRKLGNAPAQHTEE